jgi:hypothetical protein
MASGKSLDTGNRGHVAIDRLEGESAVVIDDAGRAYDVPRSVLPAPLVEGTVLIVSDGPDGMPDWSTAVVDREERDRRLADVEARVARLSKGDDGGDITL